MHSTIHITKTSKNEFSRNIERLLLFHEVSTFNVVMIKKYNKIQQIIGIITLPVVLLDLIMSYVNDVINIICNISFNHVVELNMKTNNVWINFDEYIFDYNISFTKEHMLKQYPYCNNISWINNISKSVIKNVTVTVGDQCINMNPSPMEMFGHEIMCNMLFSEKNNICDTHDMNNLPLFNKYMRLHYNYDKYIDSVWNRCTYKYVIHNHKKMKNMIIIVSMLINRFTNVSNTNRIFRNS